MDSTALISRRQLPDLKAARASFLRDGGAPAGVRPVVLEAWQRSRDYGVDPYRNRRQRIDGDRLDRARRSLAPLLDAAQPFLELVHGTLADEPHIVALADADGLILRLLTGPGLDGRQLARTNLVEGASWHERHIGSNGIGTCLALGEPVILIGPEHFQESYVGWTCIGAPIHDARGTIIGAVDLSVPNEHAHVHGWGWTLSLARAIGATVGRASPPRQADLDELAARTQSPLRSVAAVFELLGTRLGTSGTHARYLEEARAELEEAERQREAQIHQLTIALRDQLRAEHALAREHDLLERLVDSIPVMVTLYDPAVQEVRLNPHVTQVAGWTNDDARAADIMELCYPDPGYREKVRRFMQSPGPEWMDIEMTAKDGSRVPTMWANIRLADDRQVGIGIDLTDRKRTERELRNAYDTARKALQEHDHVLAVLSHDLRNPLSTLRMASSLLLEDLTEAKKRTQVDVVRRSVDQMTRLIEDLLEAARIEGGGLRLDPRACDAGELVRSAVDHMKPLADAAAVTLHDDGMAPVRVNADRARIAQVFSNLLGNAVHHTPTDGQIIVGVHVPDEPDAAEGAEALFTIRDTGRGIASDDLPRVFNRYWQGRKTGQAGAGLGLAIAKGIVEAHGGRIWAESQEGQGAVFRFTLPLAAD